MLQVLLFDGDDDSTDEDMPLQTSADNSGGGDGTGHLGDPDSVGEGELQLVHTVIPQVNIFRLTHSFKTHGFGYDGDRLVVVHDLL